YGGLSFAQTGILYAIPNLTDTRASAPSPEDIYDRYDTMRDLRSDMDKLRQGDTVSDKLSRLTFKVWVKNEQGQLAARDVIIWLTARDAQHGVFFGDRPLDNPGYSAFTLTGTVGHKGANDRVDVARVEQRLKYLGFTAMGLNRSASRDPHEFTVDGKWSDAESYAGYFFYKVINYGFEGRQLIERPKGNYSDKKLESAAHNFSVSNTTVNTLGYLNAYNAPHWMSLFVGSEMTNASTPGWYNTQRNQPNDPGKVERWATSWVRDLMVAKNYAPTELSGTSRKNDSGTNTNLRFNGVTDANHAYTPGGHRSHDLGMAMDLGINDWISGDNQLEEGGKYIPAIIIPALPANQPKWSVDRAIALSGLLNAADSGPTPKELSKNNQQAMTRDFLSLYWATKEDLKDPDSGHWLITNGCSDAEKANIQSALFRAGNAQRVPDASQSLINSVFIGAETKKTKDKNGKDIVLEANRYPDVNKVLKALGIASSDSPPHEHHFHLTFAPPGIQAIKTSAYLLADTSVKAVPQELPAEEAAQMHGVLLALNLPKANKVSEMCWIYNPRWEASSNNIAPGTHAQYEMGGWSSRRGETDKQWFARLERDWVVQKITVVEPLLHGRFVEGDSGIAANGRHLYRYVAPSKDFDGQDRASFLVEFKNGKRLLLRYQFNPGEPEDLSNPDICKFNLLSYQTVPMPQGSGHDWAVQTWQAQSSLSALLAAASGVHTELADLPGAALGLHEGGCGWNARITLDSNAAGHGWYVDATPWSVSDDYLPTSDPNLWLAKPGSGAEGK
ncbi:MAG: hypothetical protein Q8K34_19720, partial [Hydrogenophaga sp.]|nr:hypothetical protein [Hydrogenophaga sp.]